MKADAKTEAEVRAVLNKFDEAYAKRDMDGVLEIFHPDLVAFGTGRDEEWVGRTDLKYQVERDWSQSAAGSFKFEWTSVSAAGSVAWMAGHSVYHGQPYSWEADGQELILQLRITVVLERRDDKWLCVQLHLSAPLAGQAEGESFPTSIDAVAAAVQAEQPDLSPHAAPDGTVTILFSDIEGHTAINERLGDQRWMELLREHNALVREQIQSHEGYEVKTEADGFMVAFGSARKAVQCAIAIQRAFDKRNTDADEPVLVRIGLHTGEPVKENNDFYGTQVTQAARIGNEANGGEILVSALLKELTGAGGDISFSEERQVELKGLGTQQVLQVAWEQD